MIDVPGLTGFSIDNYQPRSILCVADFRTTGNVFRVTRFGHKVGNNRVLTTGSRLSYGRDDVLTARRQIKINDILSRGNAEGFSFLPLFSFLFLLLTLFRALAHRVD